MKTNKLMIKTLLSLMGESQLQKFKPMVEEAILEFHNKEEGKPLNKVKNLADILEKGMTLKEFSGKALAVVKAALPIISGLF